MNKIIEGLIIKKGHFIKFDKSRLLELLPLIEDKIPCYKDSFLDAYLTLISLPIWRYVDITILGNVLAADLKLFSAKDIHNANEETLWTKTTGDIVMERLEKIMSKIMNKIPIDNNIMQKTDFTNLIINFITEKLKDLSLPIAACFFDTPNIKRDITTNIRGSNILNGFSEGISVVHQTRKGFLISLSILFKILNFVRGTLDGSKQNRMTLKDFEKDIVNRHYRSMDDLFSLFPPEIKFAFKRLVSEGFITENCTLKPGKTVKDVDAALRKYKKELKIKNKPACPICGHKHSANDKSQSKCKTLKSRIKSAYIRNYGIERIDFDEFYKRIKDINKKRIEYCIIHKTGNPAGNPAKIKNLKALAKSLHKKWHLFERKQRQNCT